MEKENMKISSTMFYYIGYYIIKVYKPVFVEIHFSLLWRIVKSYQWSLYIGRFYFCMKTWNNFMALACLSVQLSS